MAYYPRGYDWSAIPNPDPTRHYRWVASQPARRLADRLRTYGAIPGYRIENRAYPKPVGDVAEKDTTWGLARQLGLDPEAYVNVAQNRIQYDDSILASIPLAEYERRVAELREDEADRQSGIDDSYMASVEGRGIRPFKKPIEEIADRAAFAARPTNNRVSMNRSRT